MKIAIEFNYRGQENKKTQKGKDFMVLYVENPENGEALKFLCFDKEKFDKFSNLKRGENYSFIFDIWNDTLFVDGVA